MLQVALKLLQKKDSHAENDIALERLEREVSELLAKLRGVQKQLGKLLSSCPCTVVLVAQLLDLDTLLCVCLSFKFALSGSRLWLCQCKLIAQPLCTAIASRCSTLVHTLPEYSAVQ